VIVRARFDLSNEELRALAARVGRPGLADRAHARRWIESLVRASLDVVVGELQAAEEQTGRL
jgi:hypothetical protein